jgi:hypothetical protein
MIAKENGGTSIPNLADGVYTAISSMLIDLGVQRNEKFDKDQRKFILIWNVVGETVKIGDLELPRTINKEYGFSLNEKSNLRKDLESWRGQAFTEEELRGFYLSNILNKGCQLQIINKESNGKQYNNIAGIMALAKGMTVEQLPETIVFDMEEQESWNNYHKIPGWIKEKIKKAINFEETGFNKYVEEYEKEHGEEEIPSYDKVMDSNDDLPF